MCRPMKPFEANILAGRAKTVDAKHYAMYELDSMSKSYNEAWKKFGIDISWQKSALNKVILLFKNSEYIQKTYQWS